MAGALEAALSKCGNGRQSLGPADQPDVRHFMDGDGSTNGLVKRDRRRLCEERHAGVHANHCGTVVLAAREAHSET